MAARGYVMSTGEANSGSGSFPTTAWSFIEKVQDRGHPEHQKALNRFLALYRKPVFYFLRARNYSVHEAEDLTQEFFLRFVLERDWVARADPGRGRFRTFLLKVLTSFLADQGMSRLPRRKRFERKMVSLQGMLGDQERSYEPSTNETPEEVFNRQWAAAVMDTVRHQLREFFSGEGRQTWFAMFEAYFAPPGKRPGQEVLAHQYGLSRDQVRNILDKGKKRFDRLLRAEIREQVGQEGEIDGEIRELKRLVGLKYR